MQDMEKRIRTKLSTLSSMLYVLHNYLDGTTLTLFKKTAKIMQAADVFCLEQEHSVAYAKIQVATKEIFAELAEDKTYADLVDRIDTQINDVANDLATNVAEVIAQLNERIAELEANGATVHRSYDQNVRTQIHALSDGKCVYCDVEVPLADMELDHFVPKSSGGPDNMANYVCACRPCNQSKSDKHPVQFIRQRLGHNVVRFNPNTEVA